MKLDELNKPLNSNGTFDMRPVALLIAISFYVAALGFVAYKAAKMAHNMNADIVKAAKDLENYEGR